MAPHPLLKGVLYIVVILLLGGAAYVLFPHVSSLFAAPCEEPLGYYVSDIDPRFGVSREAVVAALADAEALWEEAAGRELFSYAEEGIAVYLVYGDEQRANELGKAIDAEQEAYDRLKEELEGLKRDYNQTREVYEVAAAKFDARAQAYEDEVKRWNKQGGAPPKEYERLLKEQQDLLMEQELLSGYVDRVNEYASMLNDAVGELNGLARILNARVEAYNAHAGDAFDQGDYQEDEMGKRISVYEFSDAVDLRRVLAHEFGHALSLGHAEDPSSVMYSFNAGTELKLSEEDRQMLLGACRLDS